VNVRIAHWMIARTLRDMKRFDEALAIQLRLEREWAAAGDGRSLRLRGARAALSRHR
jgi:hypothetical protein